jgi:hypothetical protein
MSSNKDIVRLTDKLVINPNKFIYGIMKDGNLLAYCHNRKNAEVFIHSIANSLETTLIDKNIQISKDVSLEHETGIINIYEQAPLSIFNFLNRSALIHKISYHMIYRGYIDNNLMKLNKYEEIATPGIVNIPENNQVLETSPKSCDENIINDENINQVDSNSSSIKLGKSYNKLVKKRVNQLRKTNKDLYTELADPVYRYYFGFGNE